MGRSIQAINSKPNKLLSRFPKNVNYQSFPYFFFRGESVGFSNFVRVSELTIAIITRGFIVHALYQLEKKTRTKKKK